MKKQLLPLIILIIPSFILGQHLEKISPSKSALSIQQAVENGDLFKKASIISNRMNEDLSLIHKSIPKEHTAFILDPNIDLKNLESSFTLTIPTENDSEVHLKLIETNILSTGFRVLTEYAPEGITDLTIGKHYQGIVDGELSSFVALSLFDNEMHGVIYSEEGKRVLTTIESNDNLHVTFIESDQRVEDGVLSCFTADDGYIYSEEELHSVVASRGPGDCVDIYIEVDKDIHDGKGGVQGATNYITALFNQSALLYANENVTIKISEIFVWTSGKPYKGRDASRLLSEFQSKHGSNGSWNGDLAHLVSYKGGGGIAAGFNGLCSFDRRNSMCMSGIQSSFNNIPSYSWSVQVFTHEMGHLLGSQHTHACVWNGNGTAIDGCSTVEGGCSRPGIPSNGGTIMSYCHLTSVGINFNNGFGSQPGNVLRNSVANASCLSSCDGGSSTCANGTQDGDETGVDCGGSCAPCPTCSDGIQNGSETGIDCGGPDCPTCPPVTCSTPEGLFATNIKGNRAQLKWTGVSGASGYTIQVRNSGGAWQDFANSGTSITIRGFSGGVTYEWRVSATCSSGSSDYSAICSFVGGDKNSGACGSGGLALSLDENLARVYPNPSDGVFTLEFNIPTSDLGSAIIYDITGRKLLYQQISADQITESMSTQFLNSGMYILQIESGEKTQTIKFMVR